MKTIRSFISLFNRLRNGENFEIHKIIVDYLDKVIQELPLLVPQFNYYKEQFIKLDVLLKQYAKYYESGLLRKLNKERNNTYGGIKRIINGATMLNNDEIREAGDHLKMILNNYKHIERKPYSDATGLYFNLIQDFLSDEYKEYTLFLNLENSINNLQAENIKFEEIHNKRADKKEQKFLLGSIDVVRRATDLALEELTLSINSDYRVSVLNKEMANMELLNKMIDKINGYIRQAKEDYYRHIDGKKPTDPSGPGDDPTPPGNLPYEFKVESQTLTEGDVMLLDKSPGKLRTYVEKVNLEGSCIWFYPPGEDPYDTPFKYGDFLYDSENKITGLRLISDKTAIEMHDPVDYAVLQDKDAKVLIRFDTYRDLVYID